LREEGKKRGMRLLMSPVQMDMGDLETESLESRETNYRSNPA
jgi:hypothetical protein